jgi:hypothetical protein
MKIRTRRWTTGLAVVAGLGLGAMATAAEAGTLKLAIDESYQYGSGGEFMVVEFTGLTPIPTMPSASRILPGYFQTFCMEKDENIHANLTYDWELNDKAVDGGVGGPSPDPLDAMTAYLYTKFWEGTLSNYDYTPGVNDRALSAEQLQNAIWYIEQEIGSLAAGSQAKAWYDEAVEATTAGSDGLIKWSGIGNVRILNLSHVAVNDLGQRVREIDQDVLVMIPLPPAVWGGLGLLAGLGAFGVFRRRNRSILS